VVLRSEDIDRRIRSHGGPVKVSGLVRSSVDWPIRWLDFVGYCVPVNISFRVIEEFHYRLVMELDDLMYGPTTYFKPGPRSEKVHMS
jgi:hypothetical protein